MSSIKWHRDLDRRTFIGSSLAAGTVFTTVRAQPEAGSKESPLKQGAAILFQGDSITDVHRKRDAATPNDREALGGGYPFLLACALLADHPEKGLRIFNRGISGNKVPDLDARWQPDALDLQPDVLSILIGVNDLWHKLNGRYEGTVEDYEEGYRALIQRTLDALPGVRLIICEPFVLRCGAVTDKWFPEFTERLEAARRLAGEFKLTLVEFQKMFDHAVKSAPPEYWAADGVHPTLAGHALMARIWRETTGI